MIVKLAEWFHTIKVWYFVLSTSSNTKSYIKNREVFAIFCYAVQFRFSNHLQLTGFLLKNWTLIHLLSSAEGIQGTVNSLIELCNANKGEHFEQTKC